MKKVLLVVLMAACLPLLSGCEERHVYVEGSGTVVTETPPAPQTEVYVEAPGPGYVWLPGYWSWRGRWVWVSGHWGLRPHAGAVWVAGHWHHYHHGYLWTPGHWR